MRIKDSSVAMDVRPLEKLPPNLDEFIGEAAQGINALYGRAAEAQYRHGAARSLRATLNHPSVSAYAVWNDTRALAYLLTLSREGAAQIPFIHVLAGFEGRGLEAKLFDVAVQALRAQDNRHILCEVVNFCPLDLEDVTRRHRFRHVPRTIMLASATTVLQTPRACSLPIAPLAPPAWQAAAQGLVDAYDGEPGHDLHIEVHDPQRALGFLSRVDAGYFGRTSPDYMLIAMDGSRCAGLALGSEAAPDTGFVLQVAVPPPYRNQGIAAALLQVLCATFAENGLSQVGLGVTSANPARRLYERLGFRTVRPIDAYVWWAGQDNTSSAST
jgi:ribosomal protein S18 acetylase RimI-like enzyme